MSVDVVILPQGGRESLRAWIEESAFNIQLDEWEALSLEIASKARLGNGTPVEVFLCPLGDHLIARYDSYFIERLLQAARDHCWGADIYIVADRRIRVSADEIEDHASLARWFEAAHRGGAADIIQVDLDRSGFYPVEPTDLASASELSRLRQIALQSRISTSKWRCHLADLKRRLPAFLDPFVKYPQGPYRGENIVIVVDKSAVDQEELVNNARGSDLAERHVVVTLGVHPSANLRAMCQAEDDLALVRCRGPFELRYFMLQLNATYELRTAKWTGAVEAIALDERPLFGQSRREEGRGLLVTSSFDPDIEYDHYSEAARDAGAIAYGRPRNAFYRAHQAITPGNLSQVLKSFSTVTAWVYLGHGGGEMGLQEAGSGEFKTPDEWLSSFSAYAGSLPLVIFSACRSTVTARRFAQAGVGVTIGFEDDVPPEACRLLAAEVVRAALVTGGDQAGILNAYHVGCTDLIAGGYTGVGPKAFSVAP
jgi:hypothetical protein